MKSIMLAILFIVCGCEMNQSKNGNEGEDGRFEHMKTYKGQCCCGNICFEAKGEPLFTQYCHCNKCRKVASDSKNPADKKGYGFTAAYLTNNFEITEGKDKLTSIVCNSARLYLCSQCRALIYGISEDPEKQGGIGINANNFQFVEGTPASFEPVRHVWYKNRIIDFDDNLPKFKDSPKEQFGTGELFQ